METDATTKYDAPRIEDHGTLAALTAGTQPKGEMDSILPTSGKTELIVTSNSNPM